MHSSTLIPPDFRAAATVKKLPKAVADGAAGVVLAMAEVAGTPQRVLRALFTSEVEMWWRLPGVYHLKDWLVDQRVLGRWSVTVELHDGSLVHEWGEFCELKLPDSLVTTRRFAGHPDLGERETTLTYLFDPSAHGTLITVREEGFKGRAKVAYGNAENWEKVLGWLDVHLSRA